MIAILLCVAAIHGIYGLTTPGGFLHNRLPSAIWAKPLYSCPKCMASVWGTAYWFYFTPDVPYILFIFAVSGIGEILRRISYTDEPNHDETKEPLPAETQDAPTMGAVQPQP